MLLFCILIVIIKPTQTHPKAGLEVSEDHSSAFIFLKLSFARTPKADRYVRVTGSTNTMPRRSALMLSVFSPIEIVSQFWIFDLNLKHISLCSSINSASEKFLDVADLHNKKRKKLAAMV